MQKSLNSFKFSFSSDFHRQTHKSHPQDRKFPSASNFQLPQKDAILISFSQFSFK